MIPPADERVLEGKRRRDHCPRASLAPLQPKDRAFHPIDVLRASAAHRVTRLLPIKYARMRVSPFAFYRGAVAIMAADLGRLPHSALHVQLCGDAHVQNLGSFAAPDGKLVFDINDFDETIPGPWEWDVKRMATSILLAGAESSHTPADSRAAAAVFVESYLDSIADFSQLPVLQVARHQIHREQRIAPIHAALRQSVRAKPADLIKRFTAEDTRANRHFRDAPPDFHRVRGAQAAAVLASLSQYRRTLAPERRHLFDLYRPADVGFKIVGTGSVGLRDYVVLLHGNGPADALFLQIKQEEPSAYAPYIKHASEPHEGRRVVDGQRAIQPFSDPMLGWTTIGDHQFLVRQLNDHKGSIDLANLAGAGLKSLARVAGELLARGHARSGDAAEIHGYAGSGSKMSRVLVDFATAYAEQTNADYAAFLAAIKSGKLRTAKT